MLRKIETVDPAQLYVMGGRVIFFDRTEVRVPLVKLDLLGAPTWQEEVHPWPDGMPPPPTRGWVFEAPCGLQFYVDQDWFRPDDDYDHAYVNAALDEEALHAIMHLPFDVQLVAHWGHLGAKPLEGGFRVVRIDDAGVRHDVGLFPRRESAECVAGMYEARGHKQGYLVEAVGTPPERFSRGEWQVVRQDDGGFRTDVRSFPTRRWAEQLAERLGAEPRHKQTFWVERRR